MNRLYSGSRSAVFRGGLAALLAFAVLLAAPFAARAQSAAAGAAFFTANCTAGCHTGGPTSPYDAPRNGANASNIISYAIAQGMTPFPTSPNATDLANLAAYLATVTSSTFPSNAPVPYNSGGASPTVLATQIRFPTSWGALNAMQLVSAPSKGTVSFTGTSINYTPNVGATGSDSFTYRGTGPGGNTSTRTATVVIAAPPPPVITSSLTANAQSGQPFSYQIVATNFPTSYNATGLPAGVSVNTSSGLISGSFPSTGTFNIGISATNAGGTDNETLVVTVTLGAPVITSSGSANGAVGMAFNYQITASNSPTSYNATGLPSGLSVNTSTGLISGTPASGTNGTHNVTISATNATGTGNASLTLTIAVGVPAITSPNTASGASGVAFSYQITATNSPTSYSASGLPAGLSINTSTGLISGTPTSPGGPTNVTLTATNATGTSAPFNLAITINLGPPSITSPLTASGGVAVSFSYQITATNSPTSFGATGLPAGLAVNTGSGLISGSPAPGTGGSHNVTISATNATATGTATLVITISEVAPSITSAGTASGQTGVPFSYQITATNGASSYNATGLPPGVTVNTSTGLVSGTPTSVGTFTATVSASNGAGTGSRTVTITISLGPPVITSAATAGGVVGVSFMYQITASNNPTTFAATGLPAGLSVNAANGVISGTPASSGTFNVSISATNSTGTGNGTLRIVVNDGTPIITSATTASAATGQPFSYRITAANNPTQYGARGLPPGLTINTATGLIAGTPTAAGQFSVEISASNATGTGGAVLRLTVTLSAPTGGNNQSATGQSGEEFRYQVLATSNPTSYSATGLPPGLQIEPGSGLIFGTPTNGGTFVARVTATNAAGSVTFSVTITIGFAIARVADTTVNVAFQQTTAITLPISGDIGTVNIVSLPDHGIVATSAGSAMVSYTPANGYSGEDRFTYSVTNPAGTTTVATVSIVVGTFVPVGQAATMIVPLNTPTTIDLARFITASGLTGVSIAEDAKKGFVAVNGTKVTYTPNQDYFGPDSFTYVAFGNAGKSTPARVTVSIQGRPDPTRERDVTALVDAQAQAARRFSGAQMDNVHRRMETLHRTPPAVASAPRPAPRPAAADASQAPVPSSVPQLATPAEPVRVASLMSPGMIASFVTSAATGSFDLQASREAGGGESFLGQTSFWIGGTAQFGSRTGGDEQGGYRFSTDGVSFGADRRLNERLAVGVGLGFARDESRVAGGESRSKAKGASVALYASWVPTPGFFVDGLVGLGRLDFDSARYVASMDEFAHGNRRGTQLFASVATGLERRLFDDAMLVSPYARLDVTRDRLDAVTESGAEPYALRYGETRLNNSRVAGGLRIESRHTAEDGYVAPRARIEYRRDLEGTKSTRVGFADLFGEPEYTITPSGVSRNSLLFGIGADLVYRGGLRIGLDYSATRQDGLSNNQMVRLLVSQDLDARGGFATAWGLMPRRAFVDPLSVEFSATYEDNVNRSREPDERLGDRIFTLSFGQEQIFKLPNPNTRVVVRPIGVFDKFRVHSGLGRASLGGQAELQYRTSGAFDATTFSLIGRATYDKFESDLRTGGKYYAGFSARRSFTDLIDGFGEIGHHVRHGKSEVFNTRESAAKVNFDYSLARRGVVYVSGEYRKGDIVSSGLPGLGNLAIADVFVPDDAFDGLGLVAYRIDGRTLIGTVGWNYPLGPRDALDFSWRRIQATPSARPSFDAGPLRYIDNQYSIVYLMRF